MIKKILIKLVIKYGGDLLFNLIEAILTKVSKSTKTEFDDKMLLLIKRDQKQIKDIINENSKEIVKAIK
jgi:hypothetical protein